LSDTDRASDAERDHGKDAADGGQKAVEKRPAKKATKAAAKKAPAKKATKAAAKKAPAKKASPDLQEGVSSETSGEEVLLGLGEVLAARSSTSPPIPTLKTFPLPLAHLEPEVFEAFVAELVSYLGNPVYFYGRRGQKQYGLDIVEWDQPSQPTVYQVKRFQAISPAELRAVVEEFATHPNLDEERRFNARKFIVVTSAPFDTDTANIDELKALRLEYAGDLEIEVWGSEALSRRAINYPYLVYRYLGPEWARAACGFEPTPEQLAAPSALAFVAGPLEVLGLSEDLSSARQAEEDENFAAAATAYGMIAEKLAQNGFPGHASSGASCI
jgi:hypothetical protein